MPDGGRVWISVAMAHVPPHPPEALLALVWPPMLADRVSGPASLERTTTRLRFEVKYDGYRALAGLSAGAVALISRNRLDFGARFPALTRALGSLRVGEAVLDGEIVAIDGAGRSRFELIGSTAPHRYVVFDVLWWEGRDVRRLALEDRVALLGALGTLRPPLQRAEVLEGSATEVLEQARERGLEGVIAKRSGSTYVGARSHHWLKLKLLEREELAIAGFIPIRTGAPAIGALLLAVRDGARFRFAGKVGTGFDDATRRDLYRRLSTQPPADAPADGAPRMRDARWVRPTLVAEIAFTEWTADGRLRHPVFHGLREDKPADQVTQP